MRFACVCMKCGTWFGYSNLLRIIRWADKEHPCQSTISIHSVEIGA